MLYVSVRWSRLVEEKWRRSSGRMGRIVAIAEGRCAAVAVAVRGVVRAAREVVVGDLVGCLSRCAG